MSIKSFKGAHHFLSNFALVEIEVEGYIYPSVEHAYVAAKNDGLEWKEICTNPNITSSQIKQKGRKIQIREDWDDVKLGIMEDLLRKKFSKQPYQSQLLSTGDEKLIEGNWWKDTYWGVDSKTGKGKNYLGKLLMKIREELKTIE